MSRIRPKSFVHVVYRTRRFEEMLKWYVKVFDARVQHQSPVLAFLTYDNEHHRFAFLNLDVVMPGTIGNGPRGLIGVDHVAYTYEGIDALFDNYLQLKGEGILPYWCIHHGVTVSMYYGDPDGNQMEFQVDCFATNDDANAFLGGPHFAVNPIGVEFDPEDWLAQVRAGAKLSAFLPRVAHMPVSPVRGAAAMFT